MEDISSLNPTVKQVIDQGYSVASVSERLGVTSSSLYNWIKSYGPDSEEHKQSREQSDRIKQLEKELKRVTMERDILKEATVFFAGESKKNTRS
ncbi:IS3 family transposase [Alteromonas mediterranea]|uniref:IS3 family transposase n=1 Tax=Alteromonas mediterranea TaxID=314275 RepID=UPI0003557A37|nr:IS3 family transposase [Alteromonas mediterranea]AGQ00039.1 ISSwp1, transposase OrfA [Alteromonas mediterranea UM4b]